MEDDYFGIKLVVFGLQLSLIGTQIDEIVGFAYVGILVSLVGFLVDRRR